MSNIAISYARFSSAGQAEGRSLARQVQGAEEYAAANNLVLDSIRYTDLGVSAWDNSNVEKGGLGVFIRAIHEGKVPIGATLIVESFDRLSRATPREAMAVFLTIINAGVNVVTLTDPPKRFTQVSVDESMLQLLDALMEMNRANAESNRKSDLLGKSWKLRRADAISDKKVMTSKAPLWITAEGAARNKKFKLIPERVKVLKRILQLARSGVGNHSICTKLNKDVPAWSRPASRSLNSCGSAPLRPRHGRL